MNDQPSRRDLLHLGAAGALAAGAAACSPASSLAAPDRLGQLPKFRYCLNTSTIRGQGLPIEKEIDLVAAAGYDGIEPWFREIKKYTDEGGKLSDLKKRLDDAGLQVESAIGFANWIVDDDQQRKEGIEAAKRDMDTIRQLGGSRIAAPPVGGTKAPINLADAAIRYGELVKAGREIGVTPMLELWGFSKTLSRLGEVAYVVAECGQPDAAMLLDVYHIYKGGSDFNGLKYLNAAAMPAWHFNDYPADPPHETIGDADRVFCGDGIAPLSQILRDLYRGGFTGVLSLELFNRTYWNEDPAEVVKTGLEKMKAMVANAFA